MKYDNILQTIGNTPIVKLNRVGPSHVDMFVKVESFNPGFGKRSFGICRHQRCSGQRCTETRPDRR